jgi:diadenylate cyclase
VPEFLRTFVDTLREIDARSALDILLIACLFYALLAVLRGTTAMALLRGGAIVFIALFLVAGTLNLTVVNWLLRNLLTGALVAVAIVFQPEIRRALERVGRTRVPALRPRPSEEGLVDALVEGCRQLASRRHGALIVLERETGLEDFIATGRRLDATPSGELLATIFWRNAPLHDGAVIIRGDRIAAAGCTLPLSEAALDGHIGTRHRAGLGITEGTDAVAVIVSEETGEVSVASNGRLVTRLDDERLRVLLAGLLGPEGGGARRLRRATRAWLRARRERLAGEPRPEREPAR